MDKILKDNLWGTFDVEETKTILSECILTSRALGELKGLSRSLILPELTRNYISIKEAKNTAQLDGDGTAEIEIFKASVAKEGEYSDNLQRILRISKAIREYSRMPATLDNIRRINSAISGSEKEFRTMELNRKYLQEKEQSLPYPDGNDVENLMTQLVGYINNDTCTDGLIKASVAMLLFESIAPFENNNRAASRVFFHMILNQYGLTDGCEIMMAPAILRNKNEYFRRLHFAEVSGQTAEWILFMMKIIKEAAFDTMSILFSVEQTVLEINNQCKELSFYSEQLMAIIFSNLYCKNAYLIESGIAERVTSMKYLKAFEEIGILKSEKIGREVVFLNIPLYNLFLK